MTSIHTTDELLRAARENDEFREAFRREILTKELLELPQRFAEYAAATDERLEGIESLVAALVENTEAMNRRMGNIENNIESLHGMYAQQHDDFHRFRGAYAENAARKDDGVIASKISRERGNRVRTTKRLNHNDMSAIFDEAVERDLLDGIDDESQDRFANADDALLVTERGRAQSQFYIVIEASHTAHGHDLTRVANHAKVIERVKGIPAYGVVAGVRIGQDMPMELLLDPATLVKENNPNAALWHLLRTAQMDPMTEAR